MPPIKKHEAAVTLTRAVEKTRSVTYVGNTAAYNPVTIYVPRDLLDTLGHPDQLVVTFSRP